MFLFTKLAVITIYSRTKNTNKYLPRRTSKTDRRYTNTVQCIRTSIKTLIWKQKTEPIKSLYSRFSLFMLFSYCFKFHPENDFPYLFFSFLTTTPIASPLFEYRSSLVFKPQQSIPSRIFFLRMRYLTFLNHT